MMHEPKEEIKYEGIRCRYCGLIFEETEEVFKHLKGVLMVFLCVFANSMHFLFVAVVHKANYACTICYKKFAQRHNVTRHLKQLHTVEQRADSTSENVRNLKIL